jgi:dienelactone hydrolase
MLPGVSCPDCLTGFVKNETPTGAVTTVHGLITYVAKPEGKPKGIVVFLPDMFGWEMGNARLLADIYAKQGGYLVYLPNIMNGQS